MRLPVLLTSDDMFFDQGKFRWPMNPICINSGGPLAGPGSFFSHPQARKLFKRRMRYLSARYGASGAISGWMFGATLPAESVADWHQEMATELAGLDAARGWMQTGNVPHAIGSLHPWTTPFEKLSRKNSFEEGSSDERLWKPEQRLSPGSTMAVSGERASEGKRSVALSGKLPGQICLLRELLFATNELDNFYDFHSLVFDVYVPSDAPHDMRAVVHFRDRDELWYEALLDPLLRPGDWTRMVADIGGENSHHLKPVGHQRPWDDYSRTRIREMGIRIFCDKSYKGAIHIDNIHLTGGQSGRVHPIITPSIKLRNEAVGNVLQFDKWELDFDLNKSYPNPYDPEVVDVCARIRTPQGDERVVPAFFYEPYERHLVKKTRIDTIHEGTVWEQPHESSSEVEEIVPVAGGMAGFWKLRFAPDEVGLHTVILEVREKGKWQLTPEVWVHDDRFTSDGKALPSDRRLHGDFTRIPDRNSNGRRCLQGIEFQSGELVAKSAPIAFQAGASISARPLEGGGRGGVGGHGFVRRSKDPHYLEYSDGTFFYPIGMNLATPSEEQLPFHGGSWRAPDGYFRLKEISLRGTYQYDDYFAAFQQHGLNWAKIWMATWWTSLEWRRDWPPFQGVGRYSQPNAWRMDHLVEEARKRDIHLQVILMNHGQVSSGINHNWENSPYNNVLGGPLDSAREFYSRPSAKKLFKNKLRYTAARWGYSTSILDWTLCGEMDFTEEYQTNSFDLYAPSNDKPAPQVMLNWIEEMGTYMRLMDPGRHLIGTHLSHPQRGQNLQFAKALDYVQSNSYSGFPWLADGSMNAVKATAAYYYGQDGPHHFAGMKQFGKPVLTCEQGGYWHGISPKYGNFSPNTRESLDADLHCGLWAGMLSPLAGQTGYWWWLHIHFDGGYEHFAAAARFMRGEDLRGEKFERSQPEIQDASRSVEGLAFHNKHRGFAWFYDKNLPARLSTRVISGVKAEVEGVEDGSYEIEYWDTISGAIIHKENVLAQKYALKNGHYLLLTLPPFAGDVAVKFRK